MGIMANPMPTTLSQFEAQDTDAVRDLIVQGLAERWGGYDPRCNPDLEDFAGHYESSVILVAKRGSRIVGVGVLQPEGAGSGRIVRMSVAGDCRRQGIGTQLLQGLVQAARERGCRRVVLETTASWESAVKFYGSRGFIAAEVRDGDQHFVLDGIGA
jgi:ribosomal protein S18 acetylase RimI-like enzyme